MHLLGLLGSLLLSSAPGSAEPCQPCTRQPTGLLQRHRSIEDPAVAPTPCPCLSDIPPAPTTDAAAEALAKAHEKLDKTAKESTKKGLEDIEKAAEKTATEEMNKFKGVVGGVDQDAGPTSGPGVDLHLLPPGSKDAEGNLKEMKKKELNNAFKKLEAVQKTQEKKMDELKKKAKAEAMHEAEQVTTAARDLGTHKAQNVIGTIMTRATEEAMAAEGQAALFEHEASQVAKVAEAAAEQAAEYTKKAEEAQKKLTKKTAEHARELIEESLKNAHEMEGEAKTAQNIASAAGRTAEDAKVKAEEAVKVAEEADEESKMALTQATANQQALGELKTKSTQALDIAAAAGQEAQAAVVK